MAPSTIWHLGSPEADLTFLQPGQQDLRSDEVARCDRLGGAGEMREHPVHCCDLSRPSILALDVRQSAPHGFVDVSRQQIDGGVVVQRIQPRDAIAALERSCQFVGDDLLV
jgi:hypothetical protein